MLIDEDVETDDIGVAETLIARVYRRGRVMEGAEPFRFRQVVRGDERMNVARYQISSRTELSVEIDGVLGVGSLSAGTYRASTNGREIDPSRHFLLVPGEARSSSVGLELTMVNLDLTAFAAFVFGEDALASRLRFELLAPLSPVLAAQWQATTEYVESVLFDRELSSRDLVRRTAVDVLFASAAAAFGIAGPDSREALSASPATLRRAMRFMEDNAPEPITLVDVARAARLSPRGLQQLFRRELGVTPTMYLRRVRLDGAHHELSASDSQTSTVAEIAHRWGFTHLPRFATYYREVYGESPRETLRS